MVKAQATILRAKADRLTSTLPAHEREIKSAHLPEWDKSEVLRHHGDCVLGEASGGSEGRCRR